MKRACQAVFRQQNLRSEIGKLPQQLFLQQLACMSNSKTTQANINDTSSSGNNIFELIPTCKSHYRQICILETDLDRVISHVQEQAKIFPPVTHGQKQLFRLFGLPIGESISESQPKLKPLSKPPEKNAYAKSSKQKRSGELYAAIPNTNKCRICRQDFDNYYQHIVTANHKKNQKRYLVTQSKSKISLDQVIRSLINSLENADPPQQRQLEYKKRQRSVSTADQSYLKSKPKKRSSKQDISPIFGSSQQSTNLINSNGLL